MYDIKVFYFSVVLNKKSQKILEDLIPDTDLLRDRGYILIRYYLDTQIRATTSNVSVGKVVSIEDFQSIVLLPTYESKFIYLSMYFIVLSEHLFNIYLLMLKETVTKKYYYLVLYTESEDNSPFDYIPHL